MEQRRLTEKELGKITKLLSSAVNDKHQARPEDLQRASVLFYSVNQLGFALVDLDVNAIIEKSVEYYSETTKGLLASASVISDFHAQIRLFG
ncbi:MAG: hypothetical protein ACRD97_07320 [Nitrososphaeraceae archaeon]